MACPCEYALSAECFDSGPSANRFAKARAGAAGAVILVDGVSLADASLRGSDGCNRGARSRRPSRHASPSKHFPIDRNAARLQSLPRYPPSHWCLSMPEARLTADPCCNDARSPQPLAATCLNKPYAVYIPLPVRVSQSVISREQLEFVAISEPHFMVAVFAPIVPHILIGDFRSLVCCPLGPPVDQFVVARRPCG